MRFRFAATTLVLLLAGGLASACGSSASPTPSGGSGATPPAGATSTPTAASSGGSGGSACQQYASYKAQAAQISAAFGQPGANTLTVLKQAIGAADTALDNADGSAPSVIAAAVHTLRVAFDQVNSSIQALTSASPTQLSAAVAPLQASDVRTASDQVTAYIRSNC